MCCTSTTSFAVMLEIEKIDGAPAGGVNRYRRAARQQVDQIEIMTAFFHQRAAGKLVELVPLPDFVEKRRTVLAHADGMHGAQGISGENLVKRVQVLALVPVLHTDLHE